MTQIFYPQKKNFVIQLTYFNIIKDIKDPNPLNSIEMIKLLLLFFFLIKEMSPPQY